MVRSISPFVVSNNLEFLVSGLQALITLTRLLNVGVGAAAVADDATNAIGFSDVDPGRSLVSIEKCPSPIGDLLDMSIKSCGCLTSELSSSSVFDIHRIMDAAV